jgi:hypothetical protein
LPLLQGKAWLKIRSSLRLPEGLGINHVLANLKTNILIISSKDTPVNFPCPWGGAKTARKLKAS